MCVGGGGGQEGGRAGVLDSHGLNMCWGQNVMRRDPENAVFQHDVPHLGCGTIPSCHVEPCPEQPPVAVWACPPW